MYGSKCNVVKASLQKFTSGLIIFFFTNGVNYLTVYIFFSCMLRFTKTMCQNSVDICLHAKTISAFCVVYPQMASPLWLAFLQTWFAFCGLLFLFLNANFLLVMYICFTIFSVISYIILTCNRGDHYTTLLVYVKEYLYKVF